MLVHAFEVLGVQRVVLNTDARNERSRAAIARIGATFEGVLHGFRYGVEGTPRDTATFAIPAREWPERARLRLEARLTPGLIAAASQRPRSPGTMSNSTRAPIAIVRVPSAICVQWNA